MQQRRDELSVFLSSLHRAIATRAPTGSAARQLTERIMQTLRIAQPAASPPAVSMPICTWLDEAVENVARSQSCVSADGLPAISADLRTHAEALRALTGQLAWWRRPDAGQVGPVFATGHANATIIGKGGLEERDDVWVGVSLLAPGVDYPEHHHPPEEVYLALSAGQWQQAGGDWFEPGIGGVVHNPPDIKHAMRSGATPLLATWCLLNPPEALA